MRTPSLYSQDDPISAALKPSPSETEAEARRVSEQIDEDLRQERERLKRNKGDVKLLLLGQAESGKSTLQKQFQLMYKPNSIDQERTSWKTVIYFNVVHSLKHILATLETWDDSLDEDSLEECASLVPNRTRVNGIAHQPSPSASLMNSSSITSGLLGSPDRPNTAGSSQPVSASREHSALQIGNLRRRLTQLMATDAPLADRLSGGITVSGSGKNNVYVRSGWQARTIENALGRIKPNYNDELKKSRGLIIDAGQDILVQDVGRMLTAAKDDIKELWSHPTVKGLIARRKLKLDEWSEFFLRHISRVAAPNYTPTTDDILHARIQTIGVAEHVFDVNIHGKSVSWHLFDVGGARGQRHSWVPYFDDANAIIFVAPVSAFDQVRDLIRHLDSFSVLSATTSHNLSIFHSVFFG
ncbi:hypothetical protein DXG03_000419 [Asterophora parasitica]|uniref:Uncharacterized protein n=1 Tax=Asterophora parasitica TaxID=117018 RepID=A0A9P7KCW4_9AGAR|nr:hypothetical protein DXG03_000419 [Asterophora parasitica]